ncbi:H-type small acid-soluble spore protein [Bacillus timonensis]|nr:H-type small acid-soluble spore protein [Bacillus timonensis]
MNLQRAKEISQSGEEVTVTYMGKQVQIQHVDEKNQLARIFDKDQVENEQDVPITSLMEE